MYVFIYAYIRMCYVCLYIHKIIKYINKWYVQLSLRTISEIIAHKTFLLQIGCPRYYFIVLQLLLNCKGLHLSFLKYNVEIISIICLNNKYQWYCSSFNETICYLSCLSIMHDSYPINREVNSMHMEEHFKY